MHNQTETLTLYSDRLYSLNLRASENLHLRSLIQLNSLEHKENICLRQNIDGSFEAVYNFLFQLWKLLVSSFKK